MIIDNFCVSYTTQVDDPSYLLIIRNRIGMRNRAFSQANDRSRMSEL
jgi:hypothetical protein